MFVLHLERMATSLYADPAAGLREDASAGVREHPAPRLLDLTLVLAVVVCGRLAGSHWRHEGSVAITESDRILGTLYCGVSCRTMLTGK